MKRRREEEGEEGKGGRNKNVGQVGRSFSL
jgi:hypothetical protein